MGRTAFTAGRYGAAIKAWKGISTLPAMRPLLAEAHLRRGLEQSSAGDLERALELRPDDERPLRALVAMHLREGDVQAARRTVSHHPGVPAALSDTVAAAEGHRPRGRGGKNLALLSVLCSGDWVPSGDQWPAALRRLGTAGAALAGQPARAADQDLARGSSPGPTPLFVTAAVLQRGDDPRPEAERLQPSGLAALRHLERATVRRAVAALLERGDAALGEELVRRFPDCFDGRELAGVAVRAGSIHFAAGRFHEAVASFRRAAPTHVMDQPIALALEAEGDDAGAIRSWLRVMAREERRLDRGGRTDLAKVHLHLARLAWRGDDVQTAASHFERALAIGEPEDPEVLEEYAECLDHLDLRQEALRLHLRYLLRAPGDRDTVVWLLSDRMRKHEYGGALQIIETVPDFGTGSLAELGELGLTCIASQSLLVDGTAGWLERVLTVLARIPDTAAVAGRVGALVAALEGRSEVALKLLASAAPLPRRDHGESLLGTWGGMIEGAAHLRLGRVDAAAESLAEAAEDDPFGTAALYCMMHAERTGASSCAGSAEGDQVERLLVEGGEEDPSGLYGEFPRGARRCPHFRQALGRARNQPALVEAYEEFAPEDSSPPWYQIGPRA